MTNPGYGFKEASSIDMLGMVNGANEQTKEQEQAHSTREQATARVANMFRTQPGNFGPAQWAYVDAIVRQMEGVSTRRRGRAGHPELGSPTGHFRIAR